MLGKGTEMKFKILLAVLAAGLLVTVPQAAEKDKKDKLKGVKCIVKTDKKVNPKVSYTFKEGPKKGAKVYFC